MTLYINCCVRKESRTNRLAKVVLQKLGKDYTELKLYEENLRPLDLEKLNRRTELIERGDFNDNDRHAILGSVLSSAAEKLYRKHLRHRYRLRL